MADPTKAETVREALELINGPLNAAQYVANKEIRGDGFDEVKRLVAVALDGLSAMERDHEAMDEVRAVVSEHYGWWWDGLDLQQLPINKFTEVELVDDPVDAILGKREKGGASTEGGERK